MPRVVRSHGFRRGREGLSRGIVHACARHRSLYGKLTILTLFPYMGKLTILIGLVMFSQLTYPVGKSCGISGYVDSVLCC